MLGESVGVYLDGGPAGDGLASTIVDCTGETPVTLRLGALSQDDIDAALEPEPELEAPEPDPSAGTSDTLGEWHDVSTDASSDEASDVSTADGPSDGSGATQ
jgi:hypothetical protein